MLLAKAEWTAFTPPSSKRFPFFRLRDPCLSKFRGLFGDFFFFRNFRRSFKFLSRENFDPIWNFSREVPS